MWSACPSKKFSRLDRNPAAIRALRSRGKFKIELFQLPSHNVPSLRVTMVQS